MTDKIYVVETIGIFRNTYYVRCKEGSHAADEVVCRIHDPDFIEGSQFFVDESIANVREVTEEEFIRTFDSENEYLSKWPKEKKLERINVIDYDIHISGGNREDYPYNPEDHTNGALSMCNEIDDEVLRKLS